jgi:hypothetical protein
MSEESSSGGTQVQTTQPPAYQLPYLQEGLQQARGLLGQGAPQQYQGNTVVPFAPQTEQALGLQEHRALRGSPVTSAAQQYVTGSLNGSQMGQNPYLDATFNRAADQVQNRIQSGFAGSGRNIEAGRPLAAQEMNALATSIYGGAYENDRNRQQASLGYAIPLAEQDYRDISALRGVGGEVEAQSGQIIDDAARRFDYEQQAPGMMLDQYLGRISGNQGQTTTTQLPPQYRNRSAGAAGGALAGYQLGGDQYGGWGALLGGLLGYRG